MNKRHSKKHKCANKSGKECANCHQSGHEGHSGKEFKNRFFVSLIFTIPILILSPFIGDLFNYEINFQYKEWVLLLISSVVFIYGGKPFLKGAWDEIQQRKIGMMFLIGFAIAVAYFYSFSVVLGLEGKFFFWELVTLIDIVLLGHWIEMEAVKSASGALEKLSRLLPDVAHKKKKKSKEYEDVKISDLKKGDVILIKPYEKIPSDGKIVSGKSSVNESMLTGESKPVEKSKGQKVIAGSVNQDGSLEVKVEGVGENSYLNKVIELVRQAQESKSKTQTLADKAAFWLTIIAVTTGLLTFGLWFYFSDDLAFAVERMATVLVITCPHALGLAIPLVVAVSTSLSAKNGLIIRKRQAFENSRKISTVIFDKTGTLTQGSFSLNKTVLLDKSYDKKQIIAWAAALEKKSEHSIAKAIVKKAKKIKSPSLEAKNFKVLKGKGVQGRVQGKQIMLISLKHLEKLGLKRPSQSAGLEGTIVVMVWRKNKKKQIMALFSLADSLRKNSLTAVKKLKQKGIKVWMITGDDEKIAKKVADKLELDGYLSELLPDQKQEKIKEFQQKGEFVAMAGDGINDAPALAGADVGIAIGSGTDIASQSADILLVNDDPKDIVKLISFGKKTYKKMIQNLFWAAGYNVFAIPLAAGALGPFGFILSPAIGAILMSLSTVVVAINAKLLDFRD